MTIQSELDFDKGNIDPAKLRSTLKENGWVLIKNVFSKEEIASFREQAYTSSEKGLEIHDILSNEYLSEILCDDRILGLMNDLLGTRPVYFGDSAYQIASQFGRISHGFHKDCSDRTDLDGPDWQSPFSILRCGIYLQDHKYHSQGIMFRTGSQHTTDINHGKMVNVPIEPGDIVVWYLTTSHSGNAKRMRLFKNFVIGDVGQKRFRTRLWYRLPSIFIRKPAADRIAIFLTFGKHDHHLKRYIKYLKHRRYAVEKWQKSVYSPKILEKIAEKNIDVLEIRDEVKDLELEKISQGHVAIPY